MMSVPDWAKRSKEYNKTKIRRNRYFQQFEHFSPALEPHILGRPKARLIRPGLTNFNFVPFQANRLAHTFGMPPLGFRISAIDTTTNESRLHQCWQNFSRRFEQSADRGPPEECAV